MRANIQLRAVRPLDIDILYEWFTDPEVSRVWRYRGRTPDPDSFSSQLWSGVLAHFMCYTEGMDLPVAYVSVYDANFPALHAKASCIVAPELRQGTLGVRCFVALLGYTFAQWPFDRIFLECNTYCITQFSSALERGLLVEEARLRRYERFGEDGWADQIWLSANRETYERQTSTDQLLIPSRPSSWDG